MHRTTDDLSLYEPRLDYRAISPWVLRTARTMKYMLWIRSPATGLDPDNPRRATDLLAVRDDLDALLDIASGPTLPMATWKARTLFLRALERAYPVADHDACILLLRRRNQAIADWCNTANTTRDFVFLHALLFRDTPHLSDENLGLFIRKIFDPLVALTVVRNGAERWLPIATERERGPVARAQRDLLAKWTRIHYGVDIEDVLTNRALLRRVMRGGYAGEDLLLTELSRRIRRQGNRHINGPFELHEWLASLPPRAFR